MAHYLDPGPMYRDLSAREEAAQEAYDAAEGAASAIKAQARKIADKAVADFIGYLSLEKFERESGMDLPEYVRAIADTLLELAVIPDPDRAYEASMGESEPDYDDCRDEDLD